MVSEIAEGQGPVEVSVSDARWMGAWIRFLQALGQPFVRKPIVYRPDKVLGLRLKVASFIESHGVDNGFGNSEKMNGSGFSNTHGGRGRHSRSLLGNRDGPLESSALAASLDDPDLDKDIWGQLAPLQKNDQRFAFVKPFDDANGFPFPELPVWGKVTITPAGSTDPIGVSKYSTLTNSPEQAVLTTWDMHRVGSVGDQITLAEKVHDLYLTAASGGFVELQAGKMRERHDAADARSFKLIASEAYEGFYQLVDSEQTSFLAWTNQGKLEMKRPWDFSVNDASHFKIECVQFCDEQLEPIERRVQRIAYNWHQGAVRENEVPHINPFDLHHSSDEKNARWTAGAYNCKVDKAPAWTQNISKYIYSIPGEGDMSMASPSPEFRERWIEEHKRQIFASNYVTNIWQAALGVHDSMIHMPIIGRTCDPATFADILMDDLSESWQAFEVDGVMYSESSLALSTLLTDHDIGSVASLMEGRTNQNFQYLKRVFTKGLSKRDQTLLADVARDIQKLEGFDFDADSKLETELSENIHNMVHKASVSDIDSRVLGKPVHTNAAKIASIKKDLSSLKHIVREGSSSLGTPRNSRLEHATAQAAQQQSDALNRALGLSKNSGASSKTGGSYPASAPWLYQMRGRVEGNIEKDLASQLAGMFSHQNNHNGDSSLNPSEILDLKKNLATLEAISVNQHGYRPMNEQSIMDIDSKERDYAPGLHNNMLNMLNRLHGSSPVRIDNPGNGQGPAAVDGPDFGPYVAGESSPLGQHQGSFGQPQGGTTPSGQHTAISVDAEDARDSWQKSDVNTGEREGISRPATGNEGQGYLGLPSGGMVPGSAGIGIGGPVNCNCAQRGFGSMGGASGRMPSGAWDAGVQGGGMGLLPGEVPYSDSGTAADAVYPQVWNGATNLLSVQECSCGTPGVSDAQASMLETSGSRKHPENYKTDDFEDGDGWVQYDTPKMVSHRKKDKEGFTLIQVGHANDMQSDCLFFQ